MSAALVSEVPAGVTTVTSTVADVRAGAVTVSDVSEPTTIEVPAKVPKNTDVVPVRPAPETVTDVPPASGPRFGLTAVTVGKGFASAGLGIATTAAAPAATETDTAAINRSIRLLICISVRKCQAFRRRIGVQQIRIGPGFGNLIGRSCALSACLPATATLDSGVRSC